MVGSEVKSFQQGVVLLLTFWVVGDWICEPTVDIPFSHFQELIKDKKPWDTLNHMTNDS